LGELAGRRTSSGVAARTDTAAVAVQHLGRGAQGWEVAETSHFRILHQQPRELVERVAQVAERTRLAMSQKWLGHNGEAWTPKCDLYLHATAQDYSRATGVATGSPGHSRIESDGGAGRVVGRRMDMHCDNPNMLEAVLPPET